jgi:Ser/Thr protein kinase RdoA (MazF antagonist)
MNYDLAAIVKNFEIEGDYTNGSLYGSGHINDTYLIDTSHGRYLLQRVNHHVFKNVPQLMHNIERVTNHIKNKLIRPGDSNIRTHPCLTFFPTQKGKLYHQDKHDNYWRMTVFIENSHAYDIVDSPQQAYAGGKAFGRFQAMLSDFNATLLHESIPFFHNVRKRLQTFVGSLKKDPLGKAQIVRDEIKLVKARSEEMQCILRLGEQGKIPLRVTHNDTKFNNILFDSDENVICVIDLDTVMPGYVHYDFGDAIRTGSNTAAEDEPDLNKVSMDISLYEAFTRGFLEETTSFLTATEIDYLAFSAKLLTFIMGLRFLTDFIDGDIYYKISYPEQNIARARAQFKLLESMDEQYQEMRAIVKNITKK